ncbi:MAG: D-aminoacyl-tRNA deacylase [Bacteroidetes bacterium]|nr:D-aminoacyl-tRNA deacylase [Bacteroidota bacterium]
MRAVVQRVKRCSVSINGKTYSSISNGLLVLLGVKNGDTKDDVKYVADKCVHLRIFNDSDQKMNRSVIQTGGSVMVVSQFTLYGDTRRGHRPSYSDAASPEVAEPLYMYFIEYLQTLLGFERVQSGVFRAMMDVELVNDGPVTVIVESKSNTE